jgi:hypothetical protein
LILGLLASILPANASVIVQLKILDGDGATYRVGSKAARGLTVLVTDETGKPLENAAVSFRLPDEGSSGVFNSGLRTDVATTGPDGHASVWGIQWNRIVGPVAIRITAVKDQARAGVLSTVYLSDAAVNFRSGGEGVFSASHKSRTKWIIIAAVAGGAAAGLFFGRSHSGAAVAPVSTGVFIGNPTIIVGHP